TWLGGQTFKLLIAVVAIGIMFEFTKIVKNRMAYLPRVFAWLFLLLCVIAWGLQNYATALVIALVAFGALAVWEWMLNRGIWSATGFAYAALPFFAMTALRGEEFEGLLLIIILFACVWGADVFAYFAGKGIGGPKLAPSISPKKTWAGFIGSLVGAAIMSWLVIHFAGYQAGMAFFAIVVIIAVVSQVGDLFESVLKRKFGVKDSGSIIPGHGGILDRIDGLIFSSVVLWLWLLFLSGGSLYLNQLGGLFAAAFLSPTN
ncbi:MAG: phosphatidate cytidylyltransferase, partial [Pseudomonadota bacterium]